MQQKKDRRQIKINRQERVKKIFLETETEGEKAKRGKKQNSMS